ncbi:hypothetical protein [Spirosoma sp. KNUC1025]|uniref:hypothetical protein n=1 Tax=Spirosoma sp. KNUC1025 TaxID=2894082 RepID=UPI00386D8C28|nr:hypothetical protein LN737_18955 [Spirosoma sp. KNUC1025]
MEFTHAPTQSIIESIHYPEWTIGQWQIAFLFSERLLADLKKISRLSNWYEDQIVAATYVDRANLCFISIKKYHAMFGSLPQIGDRLFDEDTGLFVQERSINGRQMTITYTLSN